MTVRVRFADLRSVTRSVTLDAPISATAILAEIAEELVRAALADHPQERTISLLAISVSHLEEHADLQLELPLGLDDERRRPGTKRGMARWMADRAVDIRDRFGWHAVGYGSVAWSYPDPFWDQFCANWLKLVPVPGSGLNQVCRLLLRTLLLHVRNGTTPIYRLDKSCTVSLTLPRVLPPSGNSPMIVQFPRPRHPELDRRLRPPTRGMHASGRA